MLGTLFKSDAYRREETELVIIVTPYIVKPVDDPTAIALPTDATIGKAGRRVAQDKATSSTNQPTTIAPTTGLAGGGRELVLSNLHGGLVLGFATAALVAVGVVVFARRDLH